MNFWKIGFFVLVGLIAAAMVYINYSILGSFRIGSDSKCEEVSIGSNHHLTVRATKEDFEGIANTYIRKAMKNEPLPVTMKLMMILFCHRN